MLSYLKKSEKTPINDLHALIRARYGRQETSTLRITALARLAPRKAPKEVANVKNIVMIPMTDENVWQLALSALDCATSALATLEVQGFAVRPSTADAAAFAPIAANGGELAQADGPSVKRERGTTGIGHRGAIAAHVPGPPAWSHPS